MDRFNHAGFTATVEFDTDDQLFVGHLAGVSDIVGFHAETMADFEAAFREAVDDYRASFLPGSLVDSTSPRLGASIDGVAIAFTDGDDHH